jgi:hypothetical protein
VIIGEPAVFALEFDITQAYEAASLRALGFFLIHIAGHRYGVDKPDATMLACSLDEIKSRIAIRGKHTAPFAAHADAGQIAHAIRGALFADQPDDAYFGIPTQELRGLITSKGIIWAPDGDAAFDDGSYVLQFDIAGQVRLIAFKSGNEFDGYDPSSLHEASLSGDEFYKTLRDVLDAFDTAWSSAKKMGHR